VPRFFMFVFHIYFLYFQFFAVYFELNMMKKFIQKLFLRFFGFKVLPPEKKSILNDKDVPRDGRCDNPVELSKDLFRQLLKLKGKYLDDSGKVKYTSARKDPAFSQFEVDVALLQFIDLRVLDEMERRAFFINIYNSLTLHAMILSVKDNTPNLFRLDNFWENHAYRIANFVFSLNDIEHGVLRSNKVNPMFLEPSFREGDSRLEFSQKMLDPRIHFALNCGAKSCPPILLFSSENLDMALELASQNFCQGATEVDSERKIITLSKLLKWYKSDFGNNNLEVIRWITPYLTEEQKRSILACGDCFKVKYAPYDWSIH